MLSRYQWLNEATSKIYFPPDRKQVQQELSNHMEDLRERYMDTGLDAEAAENAAVEAMGDPGAIAADLGRIHSAWPGYLWWASRVLLIAAAVLCCGLTVFQARNGWDRLPGSDLYGYLTWKFETVVGEPEQYDLVPSGTVTTGGYTIRTTSAIMRLNGDPQRWDLILCFHIGVNWRGEELYWGQNTISEVRDDSGNTYGGRTSDPGRYCIYGSSSVLPFLGQKAALELSDVPEDTEWIEFDIGYGALRRTMHIDLQEAAS